MFACTALHTCTGQIPGHILSILLHSTPLSRHAGWPHSRTTPDSGLSPWRNLISWEIKNPPSDLHLPCRCHLWSLAQGLPHADWGCVSLGRPVILGVQVSDRQTLFPSHACAKSSIKIPACPPIIWAQNKARNKPGELVKPISQIMIDGLVPSYSMS
jgi:hypothetical protein